MIAVYVSAGERAVIAVLAVLAGLGHIVSLRRRPVPATPRPRAEIHPALGDRPRLHLVPDSDDDEPHAGDPDLARFPVSLAEARIATDIVNGRDRYVELVEVTGSAPRALAILRRIRRERSVDRTFRKAF